MQKKDVELEAASLSEARKKLRSLCEDGWHAIFEEVTTHGKKGTAKAFGETIAEAQRAADQQLPDGAIQGKVKSEEADEPREIGGLAHHAKEAKAQAQAGLSEGDRLVDVQGQLNGTGLIIDI